jgi:hypothetical protein
MLSISRDLKISLSFENSQGGGTDLYQNYDMRLYLFICSAVIGTHSYTPNPCEALKEDHNRGRPLLRCPEDCGI